MKTKNPIKKRKLRYWRVDGEVVDQYTVYVRAKTKAKAIDGAMNMESVCFDTVDAEQITKKEYDNGNN